MKILLINKFLYPKGGAEVVFSDTTGLLKARGHEISVFSMVHPRNLSSPFSAYFVSNVDYEKPNFAQSIKAAGRLIYSWESRRNIERLLFGNKPDIAHLHNIYHHLSASTFTTLHRLKIPTVLTVHDVFPLCPNHSLLYGQSLREDLFKKKLYNCVRYKCIDNRLLPSLAGMLDRLLTRGFRDA